ncbi:MAG: Ribosomal RNA small subunit methyltransferase E [uncultured Acidimicrobiales bacterium]|uniref:Ribosomal RNA small subunit methyltransferase E n=1 Tax=uncultured Acidimicrobiales bacterium TaxID=310071 RepID=A0A6J4IU68_9ACTN|nr:MAG: Ribosomal RNA small subunit methyltransferase E [uncultured Acidimicrobiales bacterium]
MRPAAWVFVGDLDELRLGPGDAHHLSRVLRLVPGEEVGASDGTGRWRPCVVAAVAGGDVRLEPTAPVTADDPPDPPITVGFSLVKGDRPELVVQKLTELGVDRILPLATARSVVRWDPARSLRGVTRLQQVAREAAMQSRRSRLPEVAPVTSLAAAAAALGPRGALCEQGGDELPSLRRAGLLVGPEGGWDADEAACGLPTVALGPTTLRAETAAIAAGALLCGLRSATVREASRRITPSE